MGKANFYILVKLHGIKEHHFNQTNMEKNEGGEDENEGLEKN